MSREDRCLRVDTRKKIGKEYRKADREMITEADDTVTRSSFFATLTKSGRGNGVVNLFWNRAVSGMVDLGECSGSRRDRAMSLQVGSNIEY